MEGDGREFPMEKDVGARTDCVTLQGVVGGKTSKAAAYLDVDRPPGLLACSRPVQLSVVRYVA